MRAIRTMLARSADDQHWSRGIAVRAAALVVLAGSTSWASAGHAQENVVVEPIRDRAIDTDRVKRDLDEAAKKKSGVSVWSFSERAKSTLEVLPVPMFLPNEAVADLAAGSEQTKGVLKEKGDDDDGTRIMIFEDEVFVVRKFDNVRVTVQGTRKAFSAEGGGWEKAASVPSPDYYSGFTPTYSGGQVNFGYVGAHYLVEFECDVGEENCINGDKAEEIVKSLALCAPDGHCIDNGTQLIRR